jgi:hypothetical protein
VVVFEYGGKFDGLCFVAPFNAVKDKSNVVLVIIDVIRLLLLLQLLLRLQLRLQCRMKRMSSVHV